MSSLHTRPLYDEHPLVAACAHAPGQRLTILYRHAQYRLTRDNTNIEDCIMDRATLPNMFPKNDHPISDAVDTCVASSCMCLGKSVFTVVCSIPVGLLC